MVLYNFNNSLIVFIEVKKFRFLINSQLTCGQNLQHIVLI
ncbi:MAG: hypothetical protein CH6_1899 [Candidatus Kapaibacterium sp.]|nr:MAG: hypothetical protein CH6_1899 [Candidatus Kapabacteria bacterium]